MVPTDGYAVEEPRLTTSGYGAYQRIQAETSSPVGLITLLYDGLRTDLMRAELGLERGDLELVNARLSRAQEIVMELLVSLDRSYGEIPEQLAALYDYMYQRLLHANLHKDRQAVREVAELVNTIAEAWAVASRNAQQPGTGAQPAQAA